MSFNLILDIVIFVALGVVLYLLARTLPRIQESAEAPDLKTPLALVYLEKTDKHVRAATEKLLRRVRVVILKLDNNLSTRLNHFKKENTKNAFLLESEEEELDSQE